MLLRQGSAASLEGRARRPVQRALHRRPRRAVRSKLPALGVQCVQRGPAAAPASLSNGRCAPHCEWSRESLLRGCAGGSGKRGVWVEGGGDFGVHTGAVAIVGRSSTPADTAASPTVRCCRTLTARGPA